MDSNSTVVVSYVAVILSVGTIVMGVINHKKCRSNCFGHKVEVSLDVENTSPIKSSGAEKEEKV